MGATVEATPLPGTARGLGSKWSPVFMDHSSPELDQPELLWVYQIQRGVAAWRAKQKRSRGSLSDSTIKTLIDLGIDQSTPDGLLDDYIAGKDTAARELLAEYSNLISRVATRLGGMGIQDYRYSINELCHLISIATIQVAVEYKPQPGGVFRAFWFSRINFRVLDIIRKEHRDGRTRAQSAQWRAAQDSGSNGAAKLFSTIPNTGPAGGLLEGDHTLPKSAIVPDPSTDHVSLQLKERQKIIERLIGLAGLSPLQQYVLRQVYFEQIPAAVVAKQLEVSDSNISQAKRHALKRLRAAIENNPGLRSDLHSLFYT